MLEVAQIKVEIQNELDTASISPILESALAMVSLELATNMIKHAKATQALLSYRSTETGVEMVAEDNGIGFDKVSDKRPALDSANGLPCWEESWRSVINTSLPG